MSQKKKRSTLLEQVLLTVLINTLASNNLVNVAAKIMG